MNFFTQLAALGQGMDVNLRIKGKNGRLTVSVEPQMANVSRLTPLVVSGTPEELDEGFIAQFDGAISAAKGLESNLAEVKKDAADLASKPTAGKLPPAAGKIRPKEETKGGKDKAAQKPEKQKKTEKVAPTPGDMFSQPAPDPDPVDEEKEAEDPDNSDENSDNETE